MQIRPHYRILLLCFTVLGVYYPVLFALPNSIDDRSMINALLGTDHIDWRGLFLPGTSGYYYRPLLALTFIADKYLWALEPSFMHLENVLLHACNTVIVYLIADKILGQIRERNPNAAMFSALLFALHPINTESVNWISGRTDLLAGTFVLLSFFSLLVAREQKSDKAAVLGAVFLLTGCLAKEVAIFFYPAAMILLASLDKQRAQNIGAWKGLIKERFVIILSYSSAAFAYFLLRFLALRQGDRTLQQVASRLNGGDESVQYLDVLRILSKALGFYAKKLFIPWPLNFAIVQVSDWYSVLGAAVFFLSMYLIVYRRDTAGALFLASVFFISPALLNAVSKIAWTPLAERYLYLASAPFCIAIVAKGAALSEYDRMRTVLPVLMALVLIGAASTTASRNIVWQSNVTLFEATAIENPGYIPVMRELAVAYFDQGRVQEAYALINSLNAPKDLKNREIVDYDKALVKAREGDYDGAKRLLIENLSAESSHYPAFLKLLIKLNDERISRGIAPEEEHEFRGENVAWLKELYDRESDPFYLYRQGQYYLALNKRNEAFKCFLQAYERAPSDAHYKAAAERLIVRIGERSR